MAEKNERKGDSQIGHFLFFWILIVLGGDFCLVFCPDKSKISPRWLTLLFAMRKRDRDVCWAARDAYFQSSSEYLKFICFKNVVEKYFILNSTCQCLDLELVPQLKIDKINKNLVAGIF